MWTRDIRGVSAPTDDLHGEPREHFDVNNVIFHHCGSHPVEAAET